MDQAAADRQKRDGKRNVVANAAEALRGRIFARPAGEQIGSLTTLARELGVGIVTVQQAARILEHEGILEVRRGPGGGYYGRRPGLADLERMLSAYLYSEPGSWREVLDITSLLFNQLCATAARCDDLAIHAELRQLRAEIASCEDASALGGLETSLQDILFRMVSQPLFELLTRVALGTARRSEGDAMLHGAFDLGQWKVGRLKIIDAILHRDPALARFEADRQNRQIVAAFCGLNDDPA
ncbi:GntR family transcriptional regulator [Sphingobium sp. BYY-5]|uniref:GntR family transcriptional regulator n=1 Tax=Sphingobium sp. BYY-5 TaxID=2926400 RepID=UPI001FA6BB1E|nr:GntR family transcriptional regulator [Sphingobium sp. BYY-5]MCI4592332.1 GntR family transcriptional regulator [Sphingobium sp. BYY-5]